MAELLLNKGYVVHGLIRKSSSFNTKRIDHLYVDPHNKTNFFLHYGDLTDTNSIYNLIHKIKPNEVYNLGAQSHVGVSFDNPEFTAEVSGIGTLRILEAIRFLKMKNIKFYQASTSELFGETYKDILYLGNLNAKRDWGHAKDYTEMQWRILQQKKPQDYIIATGQAFSVKQFVEIASNYLGMKISWSGKGLNEIGYIK